MWGIRTLLAASLVAASIGAAFAPHAAADVLAGEPDQQGAEKAILAGYVVKEIRCAPGRLPKPQSVAWNPPGFTPRVGGTGMIVDADPSLGGPFQADYVGNGWNIEYQFC